MPTMREYRDCAAIMCEPCMVELFLLDEASDFPEEIVEMYGERYGIYDGIVRIWPEVAPKFGFRPNTAITIGEDISAWLDEHSPYRKERDVLRSATRRCPLGAKHL
jgi:hypothetical protein